MVRGPQPLVRPATRRPVKDRWFYETIGNCIGISKTERATKACTKKKTPWESLPWGRIAELYEHVDDVDDDWALEQPVWCRYLPLGFRVYKAKKIQAAWLSFCLTQTCQCSKPHNTV